MTKKRRHPYMQRRRKSGPSVEDVLRQAYRLQEQGRLQEALQLVENAPEHLQGHIRVQILRGGLYLAQGWVMEGLDILEQAERDHPHAREPVLSSFLADVYSNLGWVSHALGTTRRALRRYGKLPDDLRQSLETIFHKAQAFIEENAAAQGTDAGRLEKLFYYAEEIERHMERETYLEGVEILAEGIQEMPNEPVLRANRALLLFLSGEVEEAYRISQEILAVEPDNTYALINMVHIHMARGEEEEAQPYVERIRTLPVKNGIALNRLTETLGIANDDEGILALYDRGRRFDEELEPLILVALGSAAANVGRAQEAQRFWRRARDEFEEFPFLEELQHILRTGAPGPGIAPRYPTCRTDQLIGTQRFETFQEDLDAAKQAEDVFQSMRDVVQTFVAHNPHAIRVFADMMWQAEEPTIGLELLMLAGTPHAIEELEDLAFSKTGAFEHRLAALSALNVLGAVDRSTPIQLWDEEQGEWVDVDAKVWQIFSTAEQPTYAPGVEELLNEGLDALREGRLEGALHKFEGALALDPQVPILHHNMAVILQRLGNLEKALEHLEQALELDPQYVFARCTLARYYLFDMQDVETARDILAPIDEKPSVTPEEFLYYQRTLAELSIEEQDYLLGRRHAEAMLKIDPQNEIAHDLLEYIEDVERFEDSYWADIFARERQLAERKLDRPVQPDATLVETLDRLTKNALIGTARAMPIPRTYNVRKAELIEDLAQFLTTPMWLESIVDELLDEERQALRDVLEAGGTLPWEDFTARYGHDLDEGPDWNDYEPETIMGRLRMFGLLSRGRVGEEHILLVPSELRPLLPPLLGMERA